MILTLPWVLVEILPFSFRGDVSVCSGDAVFSSQCFADNLCCVVMGDLSLCCVVVDCCGKRLSSYTYLEKTPTTSPKTKSVASNP